MAAHVAAMAPGTRIGAAHPVGAGGQDIPGAMGDKVLADTEAYLQSLATLKGRSESWAEAAVRRSESLTETEALERHVVDLVAPSLDELLRLSDGRSVRMAEGSRLLDLAGATVKSYPMGVPDRLLEVLVNPDLAYVLLVIGIFGIIFELAAPGIGGAGIAGAIAIMLALIGFGSLPTNLGGLLFILGAVLLFIIDLKAPTHGIWTLGGIVTFVLGSILLFPPWRPPALPPAPELRVSPLTITVATVLLAGFFVFALGSGIRAQARKLTAGEETLIGMRGSAVGGFSAGGEAGFVRVGGETWSATSVEGELSAGDAVEVVGRTGLTLSVRRVTSQATSRGTT
jgi:membrane-bound serine protease (ClpP class)